MAEISVVVLAVLYGLGLRQAWQRAGRGRLVSVCQACCHSAELLTCLPIIQEVLQGARTEADLRDANELLFRLPLVESPLGAGVFLQAVELYRAARRQATTIRSPIDCLISACAIRHDVELWHHGDADFIALARFSTLRQRSF